MSKTKGMPERPKPPTFELMAQDVENAPADDVVFFGKYSSFSVFHFFLGLYLLQQHLGLFDMLKYLNEKNQSLFK